METSGVVLLVNPLHIALYHICYHGPPLSTDVSTKTALDAISPLCLLFLSQPWQNVPSMAMKAFSHIYRTHLSHLYSVECRKCTADLGNREHW